MDKKEHVFSEKEITDNVTRLMPYTFPYGEFTLEFRPRQRKGTVINSSPFDGDLGVKVKIAIDEITKEQEDDERLFYLDLKTVEYLINEGFIVHRHDVKQDGKKFVQLTSDGRRLRLNKTLKKYYFIKRIRDYSAPTLNYAISISVAAATCFSVFYLKKQTDVQILQYDKQIQDKSQEEITKSLLEMLNKQQILLDKQSMTAYPQPTIVVKNYIRK